MNFFRPILLLFLFIFFSALVSNLLPYPLNLINVFVVFFISESYRRRHLSLGVILACGFILDVFSGDFFGINLLTVFFVGILMEWLLRNFLSNYHFYTVFLSAFLSVILFRLIYVLLIFIYSFLATKAITINVQLLLTFILEGVITSVLSVLIYLLLLKTLRAVNPSYVIFKNERF